MATVEEYVTMAEEAGKNRAHVAVLMYYRAAIETAGFGQGAADILLAAVRYAPKLKKEGDRFAVAGWGKEAVEKLQAPSLKEIIVKEIAKLEARSENAPA